MARTPDRVAELGRVQLDKVPEYLASEIDAVEGRLDAKLDRIDDHLIAVNNRLAGIELLMEANKAGKNTYWITILLALMSAMASVAMVVVFANNGGS